MADLVAFGDLSTVLAGEDWPAGAQACFCYYYHYCVCSCIAVSEREPRMCVVLVVQLSIVCAPRGEHREPRDRLFSGIRGLFWYWM